MPSRLTFILLFAAAVLAKRGGGGSASSSSGGSPDSVTASDYYWTPSTLSEFVLAIIYVVFTLIGGGYWLAKRYHPAMRDAGLVTLSWITWGAWGLTLLLYILAATWAGQYAHGLAGYGGPDYLSVVQTSYAAFAFECLATAAWLFVILAHTYTVWRTPDNSINHPSRPHFLFYVTLAFLALSVLFGGIVVPALEGSLSYILGNESSVEGGQNIFGTYVAYTLFSVIATVLLLASVIITQKATRGAEESQSFNPLRWMLIIVVPLWIITEFVRFVLASMDMANFVVRYYNGTVIVFDPSLFMFGIASLATIAILPLAVVKVDNKKETEA